MPEMRHLLEFYADTGPERVGVILHNGVVIEVENKAENPDESFDVDPQVMIEYEDQIKGTFHTHPGASAQLSGEDYQAFSNWRKLIHYIVGNDGVRAYEVNGNGAVVSKD